MNPSLLDDFGSQGIAFAYYGSKQVEILNMLRGKGANAVFYGCTAAFFWGESFEVCPSWGIPSGGKLEYARVGVSQPFVVFFHLQSLSSRFLLGVRFGFFFQHVESGGPRIPSLRIGFEIGHFASQHNVKSSLSLEARTDRNI